MKLIGYIDDDVRWMGAVDGDHVAPIAPIAEFYRDPRRHLDAPATAKRLPLASLVKTPPVPETSRIFCVGINYPKHADEAKRLDGFDLPPAPMIFGRWFESLVVDGTPIPVPKNEGLDWEVELAAVILDDVWDVTEEDALDHVLGYTGFNDLSARAKQTITSQFTLGKNADRSGPIGPVIVTSDAIDPDTLELFTRVNGEQVQHVIANEMINPTARIISYISDTVTLRPGDVIATGTGDGIGHGMSPERRVNPGDVVEIDIPGIGTVTNPVVERSAL